MHNNSIQALSGMAERLKAYLKDLLKQSEEASTQSPWLQGVYGHVFNLLAL